MSVGGIGGRSNLAVQNLSEMRRQLDDLQRQLGTGKKSVSYAGLGVDRGLTVGLRSQLSGLDAFGATATLLNMRLSLSQTVLTRIGELRLGARSTLQQSVEIKANGQSAGQEGARAQLEELLELLNTQAGDRYLFSGRDLDRPAVESIDHILNGDGVRAGLKQVIDERRQADLGASGSGRLVPSDAAGTLSLEEDAAGSPFGFKLVDVSGTLTGATLTGPVGAPPIISVALASLPNADETVTFKLALPDGTENTIRLTATTAAPAGPNAFTIGADPTATASNMQAALATALGDMAARSLAAASAMAASEDFFNIGAGDPPLRVGGPPFDSATASVAGTPANTVSWYTGELAADAARTSAVARVDTSITVNYGMRANEEGIRWIVQNVAAFAATTFDPNDTSTPARYQELTDRLKFALAIPPGTQRVENIASDLASAQTTIKATQERHQQTKNVLSGLLEQTEGVPIEQVSTEILALQTRLQASLQVTSLLYQLSLADYI